MSLRFAGVHAVLLLRRELGRIRRPLTRLVAAVGLVQVLQGCTMTPHYQRPAMPVSSTFPGTNTPGSAGTSPGMESKPAVDIGWREFFADSRLQRLIGIALANNRDLQLAVLNVEASRAQYQITRAQLFPTLDAVASDTRTRTPQFLSFPGFPSAYSEYQVGVSASWELDFWGRVRSLKEQALAQYLSTAQARKAAQISLVSQVAEQYLTLQSYDDSLAITRNTIDATKASYKLTKLKFDMGSASELDVQESLSALDQANANLQAQLRLQAQARDALVLLLGEEIPADLPKGEPLTSQHLLADVPAGVPSDLLTRRPDIMQAEDQLIAANANIGAARAAFFPRIALTGSYGTASLSLGDLFKPGTEIWSFMPQISLPIFEGGQNVANLNLADVQKKIEIAQYEKAIQTAFREVADGLAARATFDQQIVSLEGNVKAERRRYELSSLRFQTGTEDYLSVLTAQTDLYSAQQSLLTARLARLISLVDLYQYLGGGWIEHTGDAPRSADM